MKELENHVDIRGTQRESGARGRVVALLMKRSRPAGVFCGWWIVAAAFLTPLFAMGIAFYGFPLFYPALVQGLGFTPAQITQGFPVPGLLEYMDYADVGSLTMPSPSLVVHGQQDSLFRPAIDSLRQSYQAIGKPERFDTLFFNGPHEIPLQAQWEMADWFDRWV